LFKKARIYKSKQLLTIETSTICFRLQMKVWGIHMYARATIFGAFFIMNARPARLSADTPTPVLVFEGCVRTRNEREVRGANKICKNLF